MTISGHGHNRVNSFDIPNLPIGKQMNPVQAAGAMSTYGRRYTMNAGFGLVIADTDADDISGGPSTDVTDEVQTLKASLNLERLMENWAEIYTRFKNDSRATGILTAVYNECKAALS